MSGSMNGAGPSEEVMQHAETIARENVLMTMLQAIELLTRKGMQATDTRESAECADAALKWSQAVVILDPTVIAPAGVTPERQAAAAPRPAESAKRKAITKSTTGDGETRYEMTED